MCLHRLVRFRVSKMCILEVKLSRHISRVSKFHLNLGNLGQGISNLGFTLFSRLKLNLFHKK